MSGELQDAALSTIQRFAAAWRAGDADALAALFDDDASFVNIAAGRADGRAEIAAMHAAGFTSFLKDTAIEFAKFDVRQLSPTIALLIATWRIESGGDPSPQARTGLLSLILRRSGSDWRVCAGQNTQTAPKPPA